MALARTVVMLPMRMSREPRRFVMCVRMAEEALPFITAIRWMPWPTRAGRTAMMAVTPRRRGLCWVVMKTVGNGIFFNQFFSRFCLIVNK
jgi:hypothetical protein